ncbi:MAG: hypothetical protein LC790_15820, partial [Actinobacteria bacterium]|nr:hypothetical protein [Actinomycetota bacterium]
MTDVAERVVEINLARRGMHCTHVAWNLLSMDGLGLERVAERAAAVIDSFAVGAGWSGRSAGRTMAILSNAVYSLLYLGLRLPSELAPTIFTIPRFLIDEDWREATLSCSTSWRNAAVAVGESLVPRLTASTLGSSSAGRACSRATAAAVRRLVSPSLSTAQPGRASASSPSTPSLSESPRLSSVRSGPASVGPAVGSVGA